MWRNWLEVYRTCNLRADRPMDPISKWLLVVRCCVFPMTFISAAIGGAGGLRGPVRAIALPAVYCWIVVGSCGQQHD